MTDDLSFKELIELYNRELLGMYSRQEQEETQPEEAGPEPAEAERQPEGVCVRVSFADGEPVSGAVVYALRQTDGGLKPSARAVTGADGVTERLDADSSPLSGAEIFVDGCRRMYIDIDGDGVYDVQVTGIRERGTGNRERGTGNREQGTGKM